MCRRALRSGSEQRKPSLKSKYIVALCERIQGLELLNSGMEASRRRELDDTAYMGLVTDAEQACSER